MKQICEEVHTFSNKRQGKDLAHRFKVFIKANRTIYSYIMVQQHKYHNHNHPYRANKPNHNDLVFLRKRFLHKL